MSKSVAVDDRIPSHVFRFVERELYDYPINKDLVLDYLRRRNEELTKMRQAPESVTIDGVYQIAGTSTAPGLASDPVSNKVIRLIAMEQRAERALFYVQGIDSVLSTLNDVDKRLIKLKYFECKLTNSGIAEELNISERELYRVRNAIIRKFAIRFGMV